MCPPDTGLGLEFDHKYLHLYFLNIRNKANEGRKFDMLLKICYSACKILWGHIFHIIANTHFIQGKSVAKYQSSLLGLGFPSYGTSHQYIILHVSRYGITCISACFAPTSKKGFLAQAGSCWCPSGSEGAWCHGRFWGVVGDWKGMVWL